MSEAEAHGIRKEEELLVYERLGDVHGRAVTMGSIADILYRRGELDEALRILRHEVEPGFERLGDVRSRAVTMGKIADILEARKDATWCLEGGSLAALALRVCDPWRGGQTLRSSRPPHSAPAAPTRQAIDLSKSSLPSQPLQWPP